MKLNPTKIEVPLAAAPKYILLDLAPYSTDTVLSLSPQKSTVKIAIVYNFPPITKMTSLYSYLSWQDLHLFYGI